MELSPSFDALGKLNNQPWTARLALELLPENNGPRVEVFRGSVVVTPYAGIDHQGLERDITYLMHQAARRAGFWCYPEINVISGDDLFIPDIVILRKSGAGKSWMPISEAVLLGEIVSPNHQRRQAIDRPREYAVAGVPWFLRVDFRDRAPDMALFALDNGEYRPVVAAPAGTTFAMTEPFEFEIDTTTLLAEETN